MYAGAHGDHMWPSDALELIPDDFEPKETGVGT